MARNIKICQFCHGEKVISEQSIHISDYGHAINYYILKCKAPKDDVRCKTIHRTGFDEYDPIEHLKELIADWLKCGFSEKNVEINERGFLIYDNSNK